MNMMKSLLTSAAIVALCAAAQAQSVQVEKTAGQGMINADTGEITIGKTAVDQKSYTPHRVFANTDSSGYYTQYGSTDEAVDYGTLYTVGGSNIVTLYQFAYATSTANPGPITLCNLIYEGYWGNCSALGLGVSAMGGYCWSGLPGCINPPYNGWTFTVWTTSTAMWRQDNGDFLHGMLFFDSMTGPSLRYAGNAINGAIPDANNQDMYFDGYAPDVTNSTACSGYWFGTYIYNFGSWHLVIEQVDQAASTNAACAFYCGSSINLTGYVVTTGFVIGGTFQGTVPVGAPNVGAVVAGYLGQLTFPIWGMEGLVDVTKKEVMGLPSGFGASVVITWYVVANTAYAGMHVFTQAAGFGGAILLYCAYDCTVGY
jgi:hypothetical protein